jgi:hypothetical protein
MDCFAHAHAKTTMPQPIFVRTQPRPLLEWVAVDRSPDRNFHPDRGFVRKDARGIIFFCLVAL